MEEENRKESCNEELVAESWTVASFLGVVGCALPLVRPEVHSLRPPFLPRERLPSGSDNGRDRLIKRQSGLGSVGGLSAFSAWIIPCSRCARSYLESGLIIGDFISKLISSHEGRDAGKSITRGVEKSMLIFEIEISGIGKKSLGAGPGNE
jgi:hypothetical protein